MTGRTWRVQSPLKGNGKANSVPNCTKALPPPLLENRHFAWFLVSLHLHT